MDKILELLGAHKLDESVQADLKDKLKSIIEVKAAELSKASLDEQKQALIEEYEAKFDEYKNDITTKFSNFVDNILEKELTIPDEIMEFARKGQLYNDLIEQFKVRLGVDQGLLDEEVKTLLREAKEEIVKLRKSNDEKIAEALEIKQDAQELATQVYLYKKCEGLTESQRKHVFNLLEDERDRNVIDQKFEVIMDSERYDPVDVGDEEDPDDMFDKVRTKNKKKSDPKNKEKQVPGDAAPSTMRDPATAEPGYPIEEGQGQAEIDDDEAENLNEEEDNSPFAEFKKSYLKVLKENKI